MTMKEECPPSIKAHQLKPDSRLPGKYQGRRRLSAGASSGRPRPRAGRRPAGNGQANLLRQFPGVRRHRTPSGPLGRGGSQRRKCRRRNRTKSPRSIPRKSEAPCRPRTTLRRTAARVDATPALCWRRPLPRPPGDRARRPLQRGRCPARRAGGAADRQVPRCSTCARIGRDAVGPRRRRRCGGRPAVSIPATRRTRRRCAYLAAGPSEEVPGGVTSFSFRWRASWRSSCVTGVLSAFTGLWFLVLPPAGTETFLLGGPLLFTVGLMAAGLSEGLRVLLYMEANSRAAGRR